MGTLIDLLTHPVTTFVVGVVIGGLAMLFGKILPWWTANKKANNDIAVANLDQLEKSANAAKERLERLQGLVRSENPADIEAPEHMAAVAAYQRTSYEITSELPSAISHAADLSSRIVAVRRELHATPKTDHSDALKRLQDAADRNELDITSLLEKLANRPIIHVGPMPPPNPRDDDIWFQELDSEDD